MFKSLIQFTVLFACLSTVAAQAETAESRGEFIYEPTSLDYALSFQYGFHTYENYRTTPNDVLDDSGEAFRLGLEYLPVTSVGKIGIGTAASLFMVKNASVSNDRVVDITSVPVEAYVSYYFDYIPGQFIVPYVRGGITHTWIKQTSNYGLGRKTQTSTSLDYAAGLEICLSKVDSRSAHALDQSIGINDTYLVGEWAQARTLDGGREPDLGYTAYRLGLRFEI